MDDLIRRSDAVKAMAKAIGHIVYDAEPISCRIMDSIPAVKSCSDAISREYALGVIYPSNIYSSRADIYKALKDAPSVTVEPKQGEWREVESYECEDHSITDMRCNLCGKYSQMALPHLTKCVYPYCPWCGAKMKGADDE